MAHTGDSIQGGNTYFESLPSNCGYDTAFVNRDVAQYIGVPGQAFGQAERPVSPLHDTGTIALILIVFLLIALNYKKGHKYFLHLGNYLFSTRRRQSMFDNHTVSETNLMAALIANTCVMGGIIMFLAVGHYDQSLFNSEYLSRYIWSLSAYALLFYLCQMVLYRIMGYTFLSDKASTKLLLDGFNSSQAMLGLFLCPVAFTMLLSPATLVPMLYIAAILYILARIVFICKGFRIFFNNLASLLYFILYLCSVEIVPVILSFTGAIFLCGILQS